ncbi:MAG: ATP-binding protein [Ruthenibacterium sp.]
MPIDPNPIDPMLHAAPKTHQKESDRSRFLLSEPCYTKENIILEENTWTQLNNLLAAVKYRKLVFDTWGLGKVMKREKGVCASFYGAPGTGKTMAAHVVAAELQQRLLCVNYAEIESKYVGETAKNLVLLFQTAQKENAILLFDEADALLSRRVTDMSNSTDVSVNQTRSVLLNLLNEYEGIVLFTTNFISNFDPAFMRRILHHVYFSLPGQALREKLWHHYIPAEMPADVDCGQLAEKYEQLSGSDISNVVLLAALKSASLQENRIPQQHFETAVEELLKAKAENDGRENIIIEQHTVSEEYAKKQIGGIGL